MINDAVFTIDVEEYYHICGIKNSPLLAEWNSLPITVENNMYRLMEIFNEVGIKTTCFFLGYIADKHKQLVKTIHKMGHEIASHGMYHRVTHSLSTNEFKRDIVDAKHLLEDITGSVVECFRSPSFSVFDDTNQFFDCLIDAGYKTDSSIFPAKRSDGGFNTNMLYPHWIKTKNGRIFEFPISVSSILGHNVCMFGGGYLRIFPLQIILHNAKMINKINKPVLYYIHPREIDPNHPRIKMSLLKRYKSYVNLDSVEPKLKAIIQNHKFATINQFYSHYTEGESIKHE